MNNKTNVGGKAQTRSFFVAGSLALSIALGGFTYAFADTLYRELSLGMSGPDVSMLQTFLAKDKNVYPQGKITGSFGPLTKLAVAKFQSQNGLPALGRVGPATLKVINAKMGGAPAINPTVNVAPPIVTTATPPLPTPSPITTSGEGAFAVSFVPLLTGGTAHAGKAVPISYLQITNTSKSTATLTGFWIKQNGSAPVQSIIGLTTVDDKGGSRGATDVKEGSTPFVNSSAFAPTNATFAPGQMKLFTIKVILSANVSSFVGKDLTIDVISVEGSEKGQGAFPIHGTTWTIAN